MLLRVGSDVLHLIFAFCEAVNDLNATAVTCAKLRSEILVFKAYQVQVKVAKYFHDGRQPSSRHELLRWFDLLYNEQVVLTGGETNPRRNLLYRPTSNTFRRLCAVGVKRITDFESVFHNGKIYVLSGADSISLGVVESYDILLNTWSEEPSIPSELTALACATHQGQLYISGGHDRRRGVRSARSTSIYILSNNCCWEALHVQLHKGRSHHGCLFFQEKMWVAGGVLENCPQPTGTVECIDIHLQTSTVSSMLRRRFRPRLYVINNNLYVVGGDVDHNETTIECFDLTTQSWELCCIFPIKRPGCASAVVGTRIYVFGGGHGTLPSNDTYDYFDVVQRWGSRSKGAGDPYLTYGNGFREALKDSLAVTLTF